MNRFDISKKVRRKILSYIKRNPGSHFSHILKRLELSSGRLTYHIMKLTEAEKIFAIYNGYWKRFYPMAMKGETIPNPTAPRQKDTCDFIRKHPGATYMDLVGKFGKTRQAIIYHMNKLIKIGLVRGERVKNKFHFYLEK